jgi:NADH-quinone oxidoreductase subunit B
MIWLAESSLENRVFVMSTTLSPVAYDAKIEGNVIFTQVDAAINWMRSNSLGRCPWDWPAARSNSWPPRPRASTFPALEPRSCASPRQADVMIVAGTGPTKWRSPSNAFGTKCPKPKWCIAMGACASSGGMYRSYAVLQGIDHLIPVDVYISGCPPRPEALLDGLMRLQKKIMRVQHLTHRPEKGIAGIHMTSDEMANKLREAFPAAIIDQFRFRDETAVRIQASSLRDICLHARDVLGFDYLYRCSGVDHFGQEPRYEVVYELYSLKDCVHLRLKISVSEDDCTVPRYPTYGLLPIGTNARSTT